MRPTHSDAVLNTNMAALSVAVYIVVLWSLMLADADIGNNLNDFYTPYHDHLRHKRFAGWNQDTSKVALNKADMTEIILAHNARRREVAPDATNMIFLVWDESLAVVAQNWANDCDFDHNYANSFGENLSAQSSYYNVTSMVDNWYSESDQYTYSSNGCSGATCAHYHQVVLAESRYFGCGIKFCSSMTTVTMSNAYFLVCNYNPAVNKGSSVPYESGTSCTNCPTAYPDCGDKLCRSNPICDGLACENGGILLPDLCWCDCTGTGYDTATCADNTGGSSGSEVTAPNSTENPGRALYPNLTLFLTPAFILAGFVFLRAIL